jgi:hypothetical protein
MVVIRWKDIFGLLERAIDSTETAAHTSGDRRRSSVAGPSA